jgi:riboflavin kinase/FMN adenylyltransferase
MKVYRSIESLPADLKATVVTVGNFDGVHLGHQSIIRDVVQEAQRCSAESFAVTFDPHPVRFLRPQQAPLLITPRAERIARLERTGLDAVLVLPFTKELAELSAREFAIKILCNALHAVSVHEGEQFRFGRAASGDFATLQALGAELGFSVHLHPAERAGKDIVSSSRIRELLATGNVSRARALLGSAFSIESTPAAGRGYGSRYTVPTINLAAYSELLPASGVYVTCMEVAGESFSALTNIGTRPTFGESELVVESHLLNFHPIPLETTTPLRLTFFVRLRDEIRWESPEALRTQIARDAVRAMRYFRLMDAITAEAPPNSRRR